MPENKKVREFVKGKMEKILASHPDKKFLLQKLRKDLALEIDWDAEEIAYYNRPTQK